MAEAVLIGIAKSVLKQLGSPAKNEFKLLWNHNTDLENLRSTINTISVVLEDAERRKSGSKAVELCLERLKVVLYDADDFFDTIIIKAKQNKAKYGSGMYHFVFMVKSAHKVKTIRKRIDAIAKDIRDFSFLPNAIEQDRPRRESTHSYVPSNEVVGREKEREDIVNMLLVPRAEQERVSVIAVIGIGGMGKTTVGQLVYGDDMVKGGFDLHMWACINEFSCLDKVLLTLLKSLNQHNLETLEPDNLQCKLRTQIEGKRFFLVLDDVWDEEPLNWDKLKILLDFGKQGSVVLATTRSVKVAQSMLATKPYYYLKGISDESAWALFKKRAFAGNQQHNNSTLEGLGQQIVKKCANVPLLIVTIASFLRDKEESKWRSLVGGEFPTVVEGDYTKVMEVLKISYREFPYPVKRCFAFCSLFPKDYEFDKDELIHLWIAEGFVEGDDEDQSLESRADEHFLYLVDMCFFHKIKEGSTTHEFKMHDLVRDLAKEVAGSESFSIDDASSKKLSKIWDKSLRHVSVIDHDWTSFPHSKCNVRTFLFFSSYGYGATTFLKEMLNFKVLRVLNVSHLGIKEVPDCIGKLTHLRFLDLSHNDMERLPKSICSLHQLQFLSLQGCHDLKGLPEEFGGLKSMRHLRLASFGKRRSRRQLMPVGLAVVHEQGGDLRYLEGLDELRGRLSILILKTGWKDVIIDAKRGSLSTKSRIKEIRFKFEEVKCDGQLDELMVALEPHPNLERLKIQRFGGSKLPQWISSLDRLVSIKLHRCWEVVKLPPLSCIQSLKELSLFGLKLSAVEGSYDPKLPFFPSLETLSLSGLSNLRGWWEQKPVMLPVFPHVINVSIYKCEMLEIECMPLFEPTVEVLLLSGVKEEVLLGSLNKFSSAVRDLDISHFTRATFEGFKSLTSLETLEISYVVDDGVEVGGAIPWEFLQRLHTMHLLFGWSCSTKVVLYGVEHLTNSLKDLTLSDCTDLHLPWTSLLSLRLLETLEIRDVERVIHVGSAGDIRSSLRRMTIYKVLKGEWLHDMPWMSFPSLEELNLRNIGNLEALPQGIQYLTSLRELDLLNLTRVTSLPCGISSLSSLCYLHSGGSSLELQKRCEKPTGEDWPRIKHIEYITIY